MFERILLFVLVIVSIFLLPGLPAVHRWDEAVVQFFAAHRTPWQTTIYWFLTTVGSTWGFLAALLLPVVFFWRQGRRGTAVYYLLGMGTLKLTAALLKILVGRPRPPDAMIDMTTLSMPSGHGVNAVILYGILAIFLMPRLSSTAWRITLVLVCFLLIAATDLSRIYLGVHYPSDVLMGSLYAASGLWLLQGLRRDVFTFNDAPA